MRTMLVLILFVGFVSFNFAQEGIRSGAHPGGELGPNIVQGPWTESNNIISESFEGTTFPPAGWTKLNVAGGTGWDRITVGTTPIPGWTGGTVTPTPDGQGGSAMAFMTWNLGGPTANDSWLITPQLINVGPGDSLKFWIRKVFDYADNVDIKISTTVNNDPSAFNITVANIVFASTDTGWVYHQYHIGNLFPQGSNIYIGFREHVADNFVDGDVVFIDLVWAGGPYIPVELVSFNANVVDNAVRLNWTTATELNNRGFEIQRKSDGEFMAVGFVNGQGTTTETQNYSYTDKNVGVGSYSYRLKQVDYDGKFEYSDVIEVDVTAPAEYSLTQNYPNPFNPATTISFSLKADANVTLKVFNVLGQEVATLINNTLSAGTHNVDFSAAGLNSGVYIYNLVADGVDGSSFNATRKMILNK